MLEVRGHRTLTLQQVGVGVVSDGVDVWRCFKTTPPFIRCYHLSGVDWQPFVRIDRHTEQTGVRLEERR